jgi:hypothetical protein
MIIITYIANYENSFFIFTNDLNVNGKFPLRFNNFAKILTFSCCGACVGYGWTGGADIVENFSEN